MPFAAMNNPLACPQCSYERKPTDSAPLSECPNCGLIFSKGTKAHAPTPVPSPSIPTSSPLERPQAVGSSLPVKSSDEKYCFECGAVIRLKAEICPKCGVRQLPPPSLSPVGRTTASGRNKFVAALMGILLGGIGLHKFYLGQAGWGVVYLVFCWTFSPALVGLIEGIGFLLMSEETFARKYGGT